MMRLAIVVSHPIQYYVPWFRHLHATNRFDLKVFYLWTGGEKGIPDREFGKSIRWDIDLESGYPWEAVPNVSKDPGTHHFGGLDNPTLVKRLLEFGPDAILTFGYKYKSMQQLLRAKPLKAIPKLFRGDSHVLVRGKGPREWMKQLVLRQVFKRFAAFLYVGEANREYFRTYGVPEDKLFFAPHAVDNQRFMDARDDAEKQAKVHRATLGIGPDDCVFLFAGKFNAKKRPLDVLKAFTSLDAKSAHLVFAGSGELENELKAHAGKNPQVHFLPFQNQSGMPGIYALGDVLVLPSQGSGETWGLCVNEAFCLARPAIVSDQVGCQRDLVEEEVTGKVFTAGDVQGLAGCMRDCLEQPAKVKQWGMNACERIQRYSYRQTTDGLVNAMEVLRIKR